jgi:hypothetical protein
MRSFFWSFILTVILLFAFAQVSMPLLQHKLAAHTYTLPVHKTLYLERNVDDDELLYVVQAATEWSLATDGQVTFDVKRLPQGNLLLTDSLVITNVGPDFPEVILLDAVKGYTTLGYFNADRSLNYIALVDKRLDNKNFNQVILHELGHALGLEHIEGDEGIGTLMYPLIDAGSLYITPQDLEHFCKLYNCDSSKFHGLSQIQ